MKRKKIRYMARLYDMDNLNASKRVYQLSHTSHTSIQLLNTSMQTFHLMQLRK